MEQEDSHTNYNSLAKRKSSSGPLLAISFNKVHSILDQILSILQGMENLLENTHLNLMLGSLKEEILFLQKIHDFLFSNQE